MSEKGIKIENPCQIYVVERTDRNNHGSGDYVIQFLVYTDDPKSLIFKHPFEGVHWNHELKKWENQKGEAFQRYADEWVSVPSEETIKVRPMILEKNKNFMFAWGGYE